MFIGGGTWRATVSTAFGAGDAFRREHGGRRRRKKFVGRQEKLFLTRPLPIPPLSRARATSAPCRRDLESGLDSLIAAQLRPG